MEKVDEALYKLLHSVVEAESGMTYPAVRESASVPEVVIGLPETVRPVGAESATEVTVPFCRPRNGEVVAYQSYPVAEVEDAPKI